MPMDLERCTCWLAPSTNGEANPSTWLSMHQEVEMHATDGQSMRGWPTGIEPCSNEPLGVWVIEGSENDFALPLDEVAAIDPIPSRVTEASIINQLRHAIACPADVPPEGLHFKLLVGSHKSVEVTLELTGWRCQPARESRESQGPTNHRSRCSP